MKKELHETRSAKLAAASALDTPPMPRCASVKFKPAESRPFDELRSILAVWA
jgi:hypothetical protein